MPTRRSARRRSCAPLTGRAFGDLIAELDTYSLLRSRVLSKGRYGRTREITLDLPHELIEKMHSSILLNFDMPG
jgi:Cdc6-like AAA superfamily ATPase